MQYMMSNEEMSLCFACEDIENKIKGNYSSLSFPRRQTEARRMEDSVWKWQLTKGLQAARLEGLFTDLTILTKDESVEAHKLVLSVSSPYFCGLLRTNLSESQTSVLKLENVRGAVMNLVLDFVYTGRVFLTEEIAAEILSMAEYFQIPDLKRLCSKFIKDHLDSFYSLDIYELGEMHNCQELADAALDYAAKNCLDVISDPSFLVLQPTTLEALFRRKVLFIPLEDEILKAVMRWISHEKATRSSWYPLLRDLVNPDQVNPTLKVLLHRELDCANEVINWNADTFPRHKTENEIIIAVGGESNGQILSNTECYASWVAKWRCSLPHTSKRPKDHDYSEGQQVIPAMCQARKHCGVAVHDNHVYLTGGQTGSEFLVSCEKYDILSNRWEHFSDLPMPLHGCQAVFAASSLWVVGGNNLYQDGECNYVAMCDKTSKKWCFKSPMTEGRVHFGIAALHGCIFVIGGLGMSPALELLTLSACEKYDIERDIWIPIAPLGRGRAYHGVAVVSDAIYAIGGYDGSRWLDSVEKYDPLLNRWTSVTSMIESRSSFGVAVSKGRIYCVGGFGGKSVLNSVESYNPQTNMWQCEQPMRLRRYGLVATTLKVPLAQLPSGGGGGGGGVASCSKHRDDDS